ncbi:MAG: DUF2442 domain-containing protein [Gemmatimonadetes bacterium]|nr:DUF2442 domain-containing protein [Gemmatimonadota bacterium]
MRVLLELSNGCLFGFPVSRVAALAAASPSQLAAVEVSPGGSALRWDALDVDLSVAGLLLDSAPPTAAGLARREERSGQAHAARANGARGEAAEQSSDRQLVRDSAPRSTRSPFPAPAPAGSHRTRSSSYIGMVASGVHTSARIDRRRQAWTYVRLGGAEGARVGVERTDPRGL